MELQYRVQQNKCSEFLSHVVSYKRSLVLVYFLLYHVKGRLRVWFWCVSFPPVLLTLRTPCSCSMFSGKRGIAYRLRDTKAVAVYHCLPFLMLLQTQRCFPPQQLPPCFSPLCVPARVLLLLKDICGDLCAELWSRFHETLLPVGFLPWLFAFVAHCRCPVLQTEACNKHALCTHWLCKFQCFLLGIEVEEHREITY